MELSKEEWDTILAALQAVYPIGGGSKEFSLYNKLVMHFGREADSKEVLRMSKNVIEEFEEMMGS